MPRRAARFGTGPVAIWLQHRTECRRPKGAAFTRQLICRDPASGAFTKGDRSKEASMRAFLATSLIAGAALCLTPVAFADSTSTTSGGGANVSIVTGDNGGTTIVIDSNRPCRVSQGGAAQGKGSTSHSGSSSNSTTINTGPGGLSGSTTIGPNGPSVSMQSRSAHSGTGSDSANAAKSGECIVILHGAK